MRMLLASDEEEGEKEKQDGSQRDLHEDVDHGEIIENQIANVNRRQESEDVILLKSLDEPRRDKSKTSLPAMLRLLAGRC